MREKESEAPGGDFLRLLETDVNQTLRHARAEQDQRQDIQRRAFHLKCGYRHNEGGINRQIFNAVAMRRNGALVSIAALRFVRLPFADRGAAG